MDEPREHCPKENKPGLEIQIQMTLFNYGISENPTNKAERSFSESAGKSWTGKTAMLVKGYFRTYEMYQDEEHFIHKSIAVTHLNA